MADLATLKVKIDAAEAVRTTRDLAAELSKVGTSGRTFSDVMKQAKRSTDDASGSFRSFGDTIRAVVLGATAREMMMMADSARLLEGRLKLVTRSAAELGQVQQMLRRQAEETRMSYESVVQLYARTAMAANSLGLSQQTLMRFTELTNMAVKASGATSQESAAALIQLSQGIAAGTLRGQELMSVMEQIPAVARAIQEGLGVTQGEFRTLAAEGKITAREVIDAVLRMDSKIRKDFASAPQTVSEAFVKMKDDIMFAIADLDKATGASSNIAKNIRRLGDIISGTARAIGMMMEAGATLMNPAAGPGPMTRQFLQSFARPQGGPLSAQGIQGYLGTGANPAIAGYLGTSAAPAGTAALIPPAKPSGTRTTDPLKKALEDFEAEYARWTEEAFRNRVDAMLEQAEAEEEWVRKINARLLDGWREAEAEAARVRAEAADRQLAEQIARDGKVAMEQIKRDQAKMDRDEQLSKNFAENMQRAFGDILTEFVTTGKLSVREIFSTMRQLGGSMIGQGISSGIQGLFGGTMTAMQSVLTGGALLGIGALFGGRRRAPRETYEERMARAQAQYASIDAIRQRRTDEMRQFIEGRTAGRGGVVQSVGTVLQETTASRMIGELVAIRVATTRTADAVAGSGSMAGTTVNVTVQGGMGQDVKSIGAEVANAVDRMLGTRVQALRLTSGTAVTT